jgi:tetratricopeptide (TPR) repeat protein
VSVAADAVRMRNEGRVDEAVARLEQAGEAERRSPAVLELLGGLQRHRGRLPEAERAFRAALAAGGASVEARLGLADVLLARDARRDAGAMLHDLDPRPLNTAQRHRWLALLAQIDDAVALEVAADRVLAVTPRDAVALARAFEAAERQQAWSQAAALGDRLLSVDANHRTAWLERVAHAQEVSGDRAGALTRYTQLPVAVSWRAQARLLQSLGRSREAAVLWRNNAGAADPADDRERAAAFARAGWTREADAVLRALANAGRLDDAARVQWAWSLNTRGRYAEAWALLSPLPVTPAHLEALAFTAAWARADARAASLLAAWVDGHPRDLAAWTLLAEVRRRRGDEAGHAAALRMVADLSPAGSSARATLARHLAAAGRTSEAIDAYRAALVATAADAGRLSQELSVLYEQAGRFSEALAAIAAAQRVDGTSAALALREGRIRRWSGDAAGAIGALRRAVAADPRLATEAAVQIELGRALAEQRQWAEASAALEAALASGASDADVFRLAATVETSRGEPARAVRRLQQLAERRALTTDERRWLAGEAEQAGQVEVALTHYGLLIGEAPDAALWEKVATLEERRGRFDAALDAWGRVPAERRTSTYWRRVTWAAARVDVAQAMAAYDAASAAGGLDTAQCLEAARLHAGAGHAAESVRWYERVLAQPDVSPAGLELEIARAQLAAGTPAAALTWIGRARTSGVRGQEIALLEAQALHMSGRAREAARLLDALIDEAPAAPAPRVGEWLAWLGRTSQARGRLLAAFEQYGGALARRVQGPAELLLARGDIAAARGDLRRAAHDYARASAAGDERGAARLDALAGERHTLATVPAEVFWDSNGFRHATGSARLALRPSDRARLTGEWATGRISQGATAFDRSAATVAIDRLFPTERTTLAGQVAIETARGATQPLWRAQAGYEHPSGVIVQGEGFRESPWRAETWDARMRYNRITDVSAMPGDFHDTGARLSAVVPVGERHQLQGNAAVRHFSDGNRQVQTYLQYQVPLSSRQRTWVAVQPYAYMERWQRPAAAYFSPERQVTLGATVRAIVTRGSWAFDAAATPQYLDSASRHGFGYAVVGSVRREVGKMSLGATGMLFDDSKMAYRVQRVTVDVQVPIGR